MDVRTILEDTLFHLKYIRLPNLVLFYVEHPVCFRRDSCNSTHQDNLDYLFYIRLRYHNLGICRTP